MAGGIRRAALDGTGNKTIVPTVKITDLDIDFTSKEILWVEKSTGHIFASDYNGNNQRVVCALNKSEIHDRSVALLSGSIYVLDAVAIFFSSEATFGILDKSTCDWITGPSSTLAAYPLLLAFDRSAQPRGMS